MKQFFFHAQNDSKSKGFTFIEVLIVVIIISVLAAIAMYMFRSQRLEALNAAALTAIKDVSNLQQALYAEYEKYGTTRTNQNQRARRKGDVVSGTNAVYLVTKQNSSSNPERLEFILSQDVRMVVAADSTYQSFVITTKHTNGDRRYCYDSESGAVYYDNLYAAGTELTRGKALSAQLDRDDCANAGMSAL